MATQFSLRSSSFKDMDVLPKAQVFNGMGADGLNQSPPLEWSGAPEGTQSFVLTCFDPDAPTGSGFWHWVVYDIPASCTSLPEGAGNAQGKGLPAGAKQGRTDFSTHEYGGAAPPPGDKPHRYIFTLYAINKPTLGVPENASAAYIGFNVHFAKIAEAKLTATYSR